MLVYGVKDSKKYHAKWIKLRCNHEFD